MLVIYLNHIKLLRKIAIVVLVACFTFSFSQKTFAATGILKQINFQGKVVNANGTNVANGSYNFVFSIYTEASAGTAVWTETRTAANQVAVTDGIFRVSLGSITALPGSIDFNTDNIYLGINFNSDGEMTPRVQFTAVPQAFNALKVAGLAVTDTTGTFTLAAAKTLTVNNTLTFAGTDATTVTFQGTDTYVGRATTDTLTNKTIGSTGLTFSAAATDIDTAVTEGLTLQGRAASTFTTTAGSITLQPGGSAASADIQIGAGGAGSATPDLFKLDVKSDVGDPTGANGALYYNANTNKFRCYENGVWTNCVGAGGGGSSALSAITAATATNTIASGDNAQVWNWALTTAAKSAFTFGETTAALNGAGSQFLLDVSTLAGSTASPFRVTSNSTDVGDIIFNLANAGDLFIQDAGVTFANFADDGSIVLGATAASPIGLTGSLNSNVNFLDADATSYTVAGADASTTTGSAGDLTLRAGAGGSVSGNGGNLTLTGGTVTSGTAGFIALKTAGTERFRVAADGTFLFEKGAQDVILSVTAPATATRTYTIPDFGANDSFVGLAATQALTNKTYNGLTVTANGTNTLNIGAGLTLGVTTASKTLTGAGTTLTFAGDFTTSGAFATTLTTSGTTSVTLPTSGTLLTNTAAANQTLTSTQTSGTVLGISDSTAITAAIVGQSITLSGTGAFDQTGLQFNLSGASGTNLNDILGSGSTWKVSRAGVATFASGTVLGSQTFTTNNIVDSGALTIKSGGTSALTLDTSGAAAINMGNTNATSIALGNVTTNPTLTLTGSGLTTLGGGLTFSGTVARTITGPNTGSANALTITTAGNISGLTLNTAAGSSGNSGAITIQTGGTSVSGTSGAVTIDVGAGVTANGTITIGGTNASALTIGRAGITTTINGTLAANTLSSSGVTITGGSINSTTIGASTPSSGAFTTLSSTGATTIGNNSATVVIDGTNFDVSSAGTVTLAASQSYTGAGAVTLSSGGSSGLTFDSASGDITVAANDGLTFAATTLGNNGSRNVTINSGTGGTTATLIVKLDTSGTVVTTDTTTLNNAVGVATNTTTAGGAVRVAINGVVTATADNTVTAGDYIGLGTTTAGRAKSLGTTYPSTAGVQVIGRALSGAAAGSTFLLMLNGLDNNVAGGGGGYNLIKDETTSLTARTTLAFLGTGVSCADNAGLTQTECTISSAGGGVSFASGTPDNTTTSNNLIHLQKSGVNRFVVSNAGGLTINGTDSSVVRTTTGAGTGATDFGQTGAVLTNLTNANDQLELSDGTPGNGTITTAGQPVVNVAIGAGSQAMSRADGKYQVILGGGTALTTYDSIAGTFTASAQVLTGAAGAGALSLPRPDGRYRVIHGGGLLTTSLVDPNGVVAVGASVAVNASGNGTVAYRRANGRYLFTNGAAATATTQIYNPITDAFVAGPTGTAGVWGIGALVLPRPDGQALIVQGGATATTQLYNPNSAAGDIGVFAAGPALPAGCEINALGSIAIRKQDGKYIVISKINSAAIYDPVANTWAQNGTSCTTPLAGKGPTVALGDGAHAIPMQDGKFLIIIGGASTVANIYDPSTDTFTAHATAITAGGAGRHSIMRANGTWQLIAGGGTATNNFDTALPVSGTYQSDDISSTSLNASSTLKWTAQYETPFVGTNAAANTAFSTLQFLVRTAANTAGLAAAVDREIITSGDFIRPTSADAAIRMTVKFNRPLPKRIFDERGTWTGNGNTVTRLDFATPTLFDIQVDNSTVLRRNNFAFTEPNAQTAAPQNDPSGPVATRVEAQTDRLYLPYGRLSPANQFLTGGLSSGLYPGVISGTHPNLPVTTTDGTVVIARPDRTFLVMSAAAANAAIYDPAASTFTAQAGAGNIPTAAVGAGAFALKWPDGKFLVVLGGAATTTNIYDPNGASGSRFVAGPALIAAAGSGAMAIQNTDGTFTIAHGGAATTSSIYDPVRNTMLTGPATPIATNCGAWAIPRPTQNQYLVFPGVAAGVVGILTTSTYDASTKIFSPTAGSPALPLASGCGSFAFQRQDGLWVIMAGGGGTAGAGQTVGFLYNPAQNIITTLGLTFTAVQRGAHVIPRADGTFLIINGNAAVTTNLYIPWGGAYLAAGGPAGTVIIGTAAPAPPVTQTAVGAGALSFQRPDGKWVIIVGGATASAVTNLYDAGWYPDGQYLSEQVQVPALAANSTLEWKQLPDNFVRMEVRVAASQAALGNAAYYTVGRPGQSIANAGGETWVQVEVNLRRDFPSFCNSLTDVYASTGGRVYCYRNISTPTVFEYKLNNGMDLLNLQANGLNMLRVTSNGNIYSSATGGFYSGGADLAENYTSKDALEKGEVVAVDSTNSHSVKRAGGQYQNNVLGVVSTAPGFVAGAQTEDSYPIALVGRVPVKVSTENGQIKAGDYLVSSSIPGYAMKTNMAGRVLGKALEDLDETKKKSCPAFGMGNLPSTKCGQVMMFVNLTDYLGQPVELAMAEKNDGVILANEMRPESDSGVVAIAPPQNDNNKESQILTFLKQLKEEQASASARTRSEVFTDRVSAVNEIITPHVITDLLTAKRIKADSIEGLEILTDKISAHQTASSSAILTNVTAQSDSSAEIASMSAIPSVDTIVTLGNITIETAEIKLDLTVLGKLETQGGLIVGGPAEFQNDTIFHSLAQFISRVIFKGTVIFESIPTFSSDTAGFAVIKKDADNVAVVFDKEYAAIPIVSLSMTFDPVKLADGNTEDSKILQKRVIESDYSYFIVNRNTRGFTIVLNKNTSEDITFSWTALSVKDAKRFESKLEPTPTPSVAPTSTSPTPSLSPSATPTVTSVATSSAALN